MQQHHPIVIEEAVALAKEGVIKADAYMLEHADRDDAVEFLRHVPVVLQSELDLLRHSFFARARPRERKLLLRKRDAGNARPAELGKIERKPAPAAADVEHAPVLRHEKLRRKMPFLGELGVVERLFLGFEIGAAVLPIGVEEQRIELAIKIVMMRDVAPGSPVWIELLQPPMEVARQPSQLRPRRQAGGVALPKHDRKHVGDGAVLDHDAPVHIGFAECQHGIGENGALGGPRDKADRRRPTRAIPARKHGPCRGGDPEIPGADQLRELYPKQPIHRPPPTASTPSPAKPT
jgi:hypothetical protein